MLGDAPERDLDASPAAVLHFLIQDFGEISMVRRFCFDYLARYGHGDSMACTFLVPQVAMPRKRLVGASTELDYRAMRVGDAAVFFTGIRNTRSLAARTLNMPTEVVLNEFQFRSLSPPTIYFTRSRNPDAFLPPQIRQMRQQSLVNGPFFRPANVVGMHNDTDQTVLLHYQFDLSLPEIDRIVIRMLNSV